MSSYPSEKQISLALIGGTGTAELSLFTGWQWSTVHTRYGEAEYAAGNLGSVRVFFLPRHGRTHSVPPHLVNYQAVVGAIRALGIPLAVGIAAAGSLTEAVPPGGFAILTDFIDMTKRRQNTFFDRPGSPVVHTDFTTPYCPTLSDAVADAFASQGLSAVRPCVYLCVDGPRYETPAEIRMYRSWGADVIGMTNVPEVVLAREAGICYAAIAVPTNFAAGISPTPLSHLEVIAQMKSQDEKISQVIPEIAQRLPTKTACACRGNWDMMGRLLSST